MNRLFNRGIKDSRGQSAVEFALVLPILLLIVFGIIEFGLIFNAYVTVISSAREGARYGIVQSRSDTEIINKVKQSAGALDNEKIKVVISPRPSAELTVTVTYDVDIFDPIMSAILGSTVPVKAEITMAME